MILNYDNFLQERKQYGELYHYTHIRSLMNILSSDMIRATKAYDNTVSFTRDSKFHYYRRPSIGGTQCRLIIDGERLSDNHAIEPYNDNRSSDMTFKVTQHGYVESEERVFNDLKNVKRYLLGIDIFAQQVSCASIMAATSNDSKLGDFVGDTSHLEFAEPCPHDVLEKVKQYLEATYNVPVNIVAKHMKMGKWTSKY